MKTQLKTYFAFILLILQTLPLSVYAQRGDWWMSGREPLHNRLSPFVGPVNTPLAIWYDSLGGIPSEATIDQNGTIYVGSSNGYVSAINSDGTINWHYPVQSVSYVSTPAIGSDGTIYVGTNSYDTNFYAINSNGTLKWSLAIGWSGSSPAIGYDGTIYTASHSQVLYAINPNGTIKWQHPIAGFTWSSPAIGLDGTIYIGCDDGNIYPQKGYLYAISDSGTLVWAFETGNRVTSIPSIDSDSTIYFGCQDSTFYAVNHDGTLKWSYKTGNEIDASSPAIGFDGTIYTGNKDGNLYAFLPNGNLKWQFNSGGIIESSPTIGGDGTIYFGNYDSFIFAMTQDGQLKWQYKSFGAVDAMSIIDNGSLLVSTHDSTLNGTLSLLGYNTFPIISNIKDVPHDQGGKVHLNWQASSLDTNTSALTYYSIWRAVPQGSGQQSGIVPMSTIGKDFKGTAYRFTSANGATYYWEWIANQPAHRFTEYSYTAATLYDSMSTTDGKHYFLVSAHTNNPNVFYDSNVDSGYSVDNIAPIAPKGFIAEYASGQVIMYWNPNKESDLQSYLLYRGTTSSNLTQFAVTKDTLFVDTNPSGNTYYAIRAKDIHDNHSALSSPVLTGVTSQGEIPTSYSLRQNYPNPFNPSTTIKYALPQASHVNLSVFNTLGQRVALLMDGKQEAGYHEVNFNAPGLTSGVYFYRIQAGDPSTSSGQQFTETKKLILMK